MLWLSSARKFCEAMCLFHISHVHVVYCRSLNQIKSSSISSIFLAKTLTCSSSYFASPAMRSTNSSRFYRQAATVRWHTMAVWIRYVYCGLCCVVLCAYSLVDFLQNIRCAFRISICAFVPPRHPKKSAACETWKFRKILKAGPQFPDFHMCICGVSPTNLVFLSMRNTPTRVLLILLEMFLNQAYSK